jgi:hypothetical protein
VALVEFLHEQLPQLFPGVSISVDVTLVDATSKWKASAEAAVKAVLELGATVHFLRGSWKDEAVIRAAVSRCRCAPSLIHISPGDKLSTDSTAAASPS